MIYLNSNKVNKFGNFNRAYLNGRLIYQIMTSTMPKKYWKITHSDWQDGAEGDKLDEHTVYVTNKNNGKIRIQFAGYSEFSIQIRTNHSSNTSYTLIGELNYDWVNSTTIPTYNSEHIVDDTRDTKKQWAAYTFTNLDPHKTYFVDVISISNVDAYWNFLAIPDVVEEPIVPDEPDEPTSDTYTLIETNDQWELSTVPCDARYTTYQSFAHKGQDNSIDRLRIKIFGYDTFTFKYRSYAESNWDYLCIGELDKDFSNATSSISYNTTGVKYNTRGVQSDTVWNDAIYDNIDPTVEHFIDVIYRKDGSGSNNDDRGYIGVVLGEMIEEWRASTTEYITVKNADGTYTFYAKEYKYISTDDGKTWLPTTTSRQGETELVQSVSVVEGYICNEGNKYAKNEIFVNINGNLVGTKIYSKGDLLEEGSEDCQYQEIEWIANTITQTTSSTKPADLQNIWYDFNVPIKPSIMFQIDFTSMYRSGGMIVGNRTYHNTNEEWRFFTYSANNAVLFDNWKGGGTGKQRLWPANCLYVGNRYHFEVGNFYIKNMETNTNLATGTTYNNDYGDKTISLWCGTQASEPSCGIKLYSLKIYDNGELIRDLVPALSPNNVAGLFDKLNSYFYEPQGTGTPFHSEM